MAEKKILGPPDPDDVGPRGELENDRRVGNQELTDWRTPLGQFVAAFVHRISHLLGPNKTLILLLVVGAVIASTLTYIVSEVYEAVTETDGVALLDQPLLDASLGLRSPGLDAVATAYTDVAGKVGMPVVAIAFLLFLAIRRRSWTPVILIVAAGAGSLLMTVAGKQLIGRSRPDRVDAVPPYEYSPSFPSGHTLNATVVAGIVAYLLILRQSTVIARVLTIGVAAVFVVTIGISRVFLGHHWFTDVLAAWILGAAWLAVVITAHRLYLTARERDARGTADATRQSRRAAR
ncbi:undecaprenyl-diphosphatase [Labedella gwakjiensis]|uniref:Phosphatase PAP2 family protein n=1 Tax=Labedella gwakjiensis TaxID=390269 RepID=A0A2P8GRA2_9MICO|nr:phosphatase PAP2 family protein [Labedella gwakjiensis]PSL36491.1 undecaprenyl-diphosphatase [Labedella gwakjiensis]RUQ85587.1 phosphatase PAP2 family protein [Labedella gwakjiensis]